MSERLWWTADRSELVPAGDPRAAFQADKNQKALSQPAEDKAVHQPAATKAPRPPAKRVRRAAG